MTRSPGCRKSARLERAACAIAPYPIDDEQACVLRPLHRVASGDHACSFTSAAEMASASSRAAVSGRLSVAGSAPGTASACSGVSMSPGSSDRKRTPSAASSSPQMALMWRSAAFDAAVGAPLRIGVDRRVARYVEHDCAAAFAGGGGQRAEQRLGEAEGPEDVGLEREREVLALGVGEKREAASARGSTRC